MVSHADADEFDTFARQSRPLLLLQTWALSGDFGVSQRAVRDAMVAAWHHWAKVRRLPDPQTWVRPRAWSTAMRRRHVLPFHKEKTWDPQVEETLAALSGLTHLQRKVLLLGHLTDLDTTGIAREAGIEPLRAAAELAAAEVIFRERRGTDSIVESFEPMADALSDVTWTPTSTVMRAGTARRRLHTTVGAVATVVAVVTAGWMVSDANGAQPRLATIRLTTPAGSITPNQGPAPYQLDPTSMLSADQITERIGGSWSMASETAAAKVIPCQVEVTIDPDSRAELTRTYAASRRNTAVGQLTEVSTSAMAAQVAYKRLLTWVAGCADNRVQLDAAYRIDGVANNAILVQLTDFNDPRSVRIVALARTGSITTAVSTVRPSSATNSPKAVAALLGDAVDAACTLPNAGTCTTTPSLTRITPPAVGTHPGMLQTVDLPPVTSVDQPWVGTEPREATFNPAATRCDQTNFDRKDVSTTLTQTFLIPGDESLPNEFGLSQTAARFDSATAAKKFVAGIRKKMSTCSDRELGTDVTEVQNRTKDGEDFSIWHISVEISDDESVLYFMSVVRSGKVVSHVGFVPADGVRMADGAFWTLSERSLKRLTYF